MLQSLIEDFKAAIVIVSSELKERVKCENTINFNKHECEKNE